MQLRYKHSKTAKTPPFAQGFFSMPSYLDLGLIGVVLISALLSMVRGFTREVLAIISWGAAAAAAYYFHPLVLPYLKPYIQKDTIALGVAVAAVFFVTLVIISVVTVKLSDAILDSKVGALDRTLGFVFGAARGFLLCVVAFLLFVWLMPEKGMPEWAANAKTRPMLEAAGEQLRGALPAGTADIIFKYLKKPQPGAPGEPLQEPDAETKPVAPAALPPAAVPPIAAPPPALPPVVTPPAVTPPLKKTDATPPAKPGTVPLDKQKLNALAAGAANTGAKP